MASSLIRDIVLAFRPKTLTAAVVPCVAATALAFYVQGHVDIVVFGCALLSALFIQIGTNLVNDAVDFVKGADTAERIGPRRITASGVLHHRQTMALAGLAFLLAAGAGVPLVLKGGWVIFVIGLISIAMGYAYTAGPFPLAYLGLGDLFVVLFFGIVAVSGMFFLHTGEFTADAFWLGLQVGFHATVLIAINNLRDHEGDRRVGKKTLAVRFGERFSKIEITLLLLLPFVMNAWWFAKGAVWAALLPWIVLPLAIKIASALRKARPSPEMNKFLAMSAGVHLLFAVLLSLGLWQS